MPNWVCNHLTIEGENSVDIMKSMLIDDEDSEYGYEFDFNKILPMPKELEIYSQGITKTCAKLFINNMLEDSPAYKKYEKLFLKAYGKDLVMTEDEITKEMNGMLKFRDFQSKELFFKTKADVNAYGKRALDNFAKYKATDWYDWCCDNWGTKWNACHSQINDMEKADIYFDTAWSSVPKLMAMLAAKHPDCKFEYEYAEEQPGINAGYIIFENGAPVKGEHFADGSKEAYETFFGLWGCDDEFRFNEETGTYESIEEQEEM